jgi:hypothetical protein
MNKSSEANPPMPEEQGQIDEQIQARKPAKDEPRQSAEEARSRSLDRKQTPQNQPIDEGRVNAGVVGLYQEMLKEPVPEEWLRLVRNIEIKERK